MLYYHAKENFIKSRLGKYCSIDEIFGVLDFSSRIACMKSKEKIESVLLKEKLLCESVTDAINKYKKVMPFPFISLHVTNSETYYDSHTVFLRLD